MEVRVSDVKKWAGREEAFQLVEPWPQEARERVDFPLTDPAVIDVLVRNTGGGTLIVDVSGTVEADAVCSRCAEPFHIVLPFEATEEFRDEPGPDDESLDYWRFTGDKIQLDKMVSDAAGVSFPIALLCRPDCRGLCPTCGTNLNESDCDCAPATDDRWAALAQLKIPGDSEDRDEEVGREKHGRTKA
ncbi:YceD family protein [Sulfobacillus harzensis]|uniref:DUF177 domain-containing protein n=1 Tax=Sulfobacillus harzensis TaxID=2729629 RepID=A0A7Y0Q2A3_9FIRM|nr:DUF177 domain-containing protein [Sulfobacillus harzensis]NMP22983.1 DUF177 domain-containing protein [Sulfobacillus harzensis]